jgi:hypothetical protein
VTKLRRTVLLLALAAAAVLLLWGDPAPPGTADVVQPRERPLRSEATAPGKAARPRQPSLRPVAPREALWADAGVMEPARDLFAARDWQPRTEPVRTAAPAPEPAVPALPFVFQGKRQDGQAWEVFLGSGTQTLFVREGDVLDGVYRVESIRPPVLALTYLPMGLQQTLEIGGTD